MTEKNMHHTWSSNATEVLTDFRSKKDLKELEKVSNEGSVNFIRCPSDVPKFDFQLFVNEEAKTLQGVVYFGTHVQGPPGCVHGGAIASILDAAFGTLLWDLKMVCVTVNLSVNYKNFIHLNSEVQIFCEIEKIEGRKIFVKGKLLSLNGETVHDESTAIFIKMEKN
jgi:thioesterase superfamily protein 4